MLPSWSGFSRIFDNTFDTYWWFGEPYYKKFGQRWPYEGETPPEGYVYPTKDGFGTALAGAVLISILRFVIERLIGGPFGKWLGVKESTKTTPAEENEVLETMLKSNKYKKPSQEKIDEASMITGLTVRQIQVWVRRRQREVIPSQLTKFKEAFWRLSFYSFAFTYGLAVLWKEDFFWDTKLCWVGYPEHTWAIKKSIYYYYLLEGSFYLSLMVSQFLDTKRKDFWEMFIHHIATLALIGFSWFGGTTRIGALVMVTHDFADIFLEFAKVNVYCRKMSLANIGFAGFASSFFISRLVLYPIRLLLVSSRTMPAHWPITSIYGTCAIALQVLHIFWFFTIIKMTVRVIYNNTDIDRDDRSDDELSLSDEEKDDKKKR